MEINQSLVKEFHETFNAPVAETPTLIPAKRASLRYKLMLEELDEYAVAVTNRDIVEIADSLGYLLYVVLGTAVEHGLDLEPILAEIHRSNMSKLGAEGNPIFREDGKILKGPKFFLPDLDKVVKSLATVHADSDGGAG
jgi:predicted HAD superfamily Cof-like phosphohydrolase